MTASPHNAMVLGLGMSGLAAARLLAGEGAEVTVVDQRNTPALNVSAAELQDAGARVMLGAETLPEGRFATVVVSPGLAVDHPWVVELQARGARVISELELAASRVACPMVAITGTNGKSTLVTLCREALSASGLRVAEGGNNEVALSGLVQASKELDWLVVEVSSFQLEWIDAFHPRIGVLLNIQPDHLDRHGSMAVYAAAKARLFENLDAGDTAIVEYRALPRVRDAIPTTCRLWQLGDRDLVYHEGRVVTASGSVNVEGSRFANGVLGNAAAAAAGVLVAAGRPVDVLEGVVREFRPLAHRLETVAEVKGVRFVNDSKATNLAALGAAVEAMDRPVHLIAGGRPKGDDPAVLKEVLAKHVRRVYGVGEASESLGRSWQDVIDVRHCGTLASAFDEAVSEARAGECVLLSPGCASFDQYRGYAERGSHFVQLVHQFEEDA